VIPKGWTIELMLGHPKIAVRGPDGEGCIVKADDNQQAQRVLYELAKAVLYQHGDEQTCCATCGDPLSAQCWCRTVKLRQVNVRTAKDVADQRCPMCGLLVPPFKAHLCQPQLHRIRANVEARIIASNWARAAQEADDEGRYWRPWPHYRGRNPRALDRWLR
jgi:hypothetical protein